MVFNKMLTVTTLDGNNYNFNDVGVQGAATTAYNQYMAHQTIHSYIQDNGGYVEIFIPYSSIMNVFVGEEKKDSYIWDKNCSEGSCDGLYFFYAIGSPSFSALEEGAVITLPNLETIMGVACAASPDFPDFSELIQLSAEASDPSVVTITPEANVNICDIFPVATNSETEITLSVPSQGCVRKFTVRIGQ